MSDLEQDPDSDPDPFFHETDPRIRIHNKMKRIRNNDLYYSTELIFFLAKLCFSSSCIIST